MTLINKFNADFRRLSVQICVICTVRRCGSKNLRRYLYSSKKFNNLKMNENKVLISDIKKTV